MVDILVFDFVGGKGGGVGRLRSVCPEFPYVSCVVQGRMDPSQRKYSNSILSKVT